MRPLNKGKKHILSKEVQIQKRPIAFVTFRLLDSTEHVFFFLLMKLFCNKRHGPLYFETKVEPIMFILVLERDSDRL